MNFGSLLFSFDGRINRAKYWIAVVCYIVIMAIAAGLLMLGMPGMVVAGILYLVMIVSGVFVGIKRLHDRDKSGWWLLLFYLVPGILSGVGQASGSQALMGIFGLVSLVISIWSFVELGCLRGTAGPNKYGPDPLPAQPQALAA